MQLSAINITSQIGHFTVVYLVANTLILSEAEGDLVVIRDQYLVSMITK